MSYRFEAGETVAAGARRIAGEQLAKALRELDDPELDVHETIHQLRKRCKKLRGLVRIIRPVVPDLYDRENTIYRDAARTVSDLRDATAFLETYDVLLDYYADEVDRRAFGPIRGALTRRRQRLVEEQEPTERLAAFREVLETSRERARTWEIPADGYDAIRAGLRKTYKRGWKRTAEAHASPSNEVFHEWRKRTKYHRYHMKLLRNLWNPLVNERRHELHDLTDYQGDDHDLAELREAMVSEERLFGNLSHQQAFFGLMDRRRGELQAHALVLGQRAFAEPPDAFVDRFGIYWEAWEAETAQPFNISAPLTPTPEPISV